MTLHKSTAASVLSRRALLLNGAAMADGCRPARHGAALCCSRECINSFGKKVGQEADSLRSSSLIPALKPFRSRLAEVASKEY